MSNRNALSSYDKRAIRDRLAEKIRLAQQDGLLVEVRQAGANSDAFYRETEAFLDMIARKVETPRR